MISWESGSGVQCKERSVRVMKGLNYKIGVYGEARIVVLQLFKPVRSNPDTMLTM